MNNEASNPEYFIVVSISKDLEIYNPQLSRESNTCLYFVGFPLFLNIPSYKFSMSILVHSETRGDDHRRLLICIF